MKKPECDDLSTDSVVFRWFLRTRRKYYFKIHQIASLSLTDHTVHLLLNFNGWFFCFTFLLCTECLPNTEQLEASENQWQKKKLVSIEILVSLRTFRCDPSQCDAFHTYAHTHTHDAWKNVTVKKSNTHTNPADGHKRKLKKHKRVRTSIHSGQ